jgi:hypothetical protein
MSSPSQPAKPKGEIRDSDTAPRTTSTPISQLVLDPVMVENAWTTIRSFLPPDGVRPRNMDGTDRGGKENLGLAMKRHVDDGKAEDRAWGFIRGNVERAMARRVQSRGVNASATMGVKGRDSSMDQPLGSSDLANQQPSIDIPIFGSMNEASAPIPTSKLPPVITQKHKSDKIITDRRRQLVEQWVTAQRDRVRDRPGYVESAFQEPRSDTSGGGGSASGVLTNLGEGKRAVVRPSSTGQHHENTMCERRSPRVIVVLQAG